MGNSGKPYFRGQTVSRLDTKGRLRIPNKFREVLQEHYSDTLMITILGKCLVAYPKAIWEERIESKVENFSPVDPQQRAFMRYFVSSAELCQCDNHGRILIPQLLRDRAGIGQEVVLAGLLNSFEIWDRGAWDEELKRASDQHEQIMEKMAIVGL
ncbi:MAG: division/cell wall cluster transcriptional repressor MraZ [Deltaproteobacteria bacterium]|nr:division/cell wall cluster transcriptional repressor MraZ [Deltaproteobacteria bacterium]